MNMEGNKMKIVILFVIFCASLFAQNNQLTNYDRASELDSLFNKIKNDVYTQADINNFLNAKQNTLVSGSNIKTINGTSLVGSGNINLDSTGGGSRSRNWRYPMDFGAVGNGINNDGTALMKTFVALNSGEPAEDSIFVQLDAGATYYVGNTSFFWSTAYQGVRYLYIEGNGATITKDTMKLDNGYFLNFTSYYNDLTGFVPIPEAYPKGSIEITVPSGVASGAKRGDVLWITTLSDLGGISQDPPWLRNSFKKSELAEILEVNGNSIKLTKPLEEQYSAGDTTVIKRFFFPTVIIRNLNLEGVVTWCSPDLRNRAIELNGVNNFLLENIDARGWEYKGISVDNSINGVIRNCTVTDVYACPQGHNYGIVLAGVQNVLVEGCNLLDGRHGIDVAATIHFPSYHVQIINNVIGSNQGAGNSSLATHPGVRDVLMANNIVYGLIGTRSTHNIIVNNSIHAYHKPGGGIGMTGISIGGNWNPNGGYNVIAGNYIEGHSGGIEFYAGNSGGMIGNMLVYGNSVYSHRFFLLNSSFNGDETQYMDNIIIMNNEFKANDEIDNVNVAMSFGAGNIDTLIIRNLQIHNNTMRGKNYVMAIFGENNRMHIETMSVKNNMFFSNGALDVQSSATIQFLDYQGNILSDITGGWQKPIWLRSGTTVGTFRHLANAYIDFGNTGGEAIVTLAGTVTNFYRGLDILVNTTASLYTGSATNGYRIDWTSD